MRTLVQILAAKPHIGVIAGITSIPLTALVAKFSLWLSFIAAILGVVIALITLVLKIREIIRDWKKPL